MNFSRGLVILVIALAAGLCWWIIRPMMATPAPIAAASSPAPTPAPVIVKPPPPQPAPVVVAPVVAPAPVQEAAPEPAAAQVPADPRLAADTALTDFTRIVDSGDYVTAAETYVQIPPNVPPEQFVAQLQQSANFPQLVQMVQDTMHAAQNVAPTYNDAGDTATYNFQVPVDGQSSIRWRKVNGQWYLDAIGGN